MCCLGGGGQAGSTVVQMWDVMKGEEILSVQVGTRARDGGRGCKKVLGRTLACCSGKGIDLYSASVGEHIGRLGGGMGVALSVDSLGTEGDGKYVSLSADRAVRLWRGGSPDRVMDMGRWWSPYSDDFGFVRGGGAGGASCCLGSAVFLIPDH